MKIFYLNGTRTLLRLSFSLSAVLLSLTVVIFYENAVAAEGATDPDLELVEKISKGKALMQANQLNKAEQYFLGLLESYPNHAELFYNLGSIEMRRQRYQVGLQYILTSSLLVPHNVKYHVALSRLYKFFRNAEKSIYEFNEILKYAVKGSDEYNIALREKGFLQASTLAQQGKLEQAETLFQSLVRQFPKDAELLYRLGVSQVLQQKFSLAEETFLSVIEKFPAYLEVFSSLTTLYEQTGRPQLAVDTLQKNIEIAPPGPALDQAKVRLGITEGRLLLLSGNIREAFETLNAVLEINPNQPIALSTLSEVYVYMEELDNAQLALEKVIKLSPNNLRPKLRLAELYIRQNKIKQGGDLLVKLLEQGKGTKEAKEAEQLFGLLAKSEQGRKYLEAINQSKIEVALADVEEAPKDTEKRLALVRLYLRGQNIDQAEKHLLIINQQDSHEVMALAMLGDLYRSKGDVDNAILYYEKTVIEDPNLEKVHRVLASIYDATSRFSEAVIAYSSALTLVDKESEAKSLMDKIRMASAKQLFQDQAWTKARLAFEDIFQRNERDSMALFYIALIDTNENKLENAILSYRKVIELMPGNISARMNLASIYAQTYREVDAIGEYRQIIQSKANETMKKRARAIMESLENSISGYSTSLSYSINYDGNSNLNEIDPREEYTSALSFNLGYNQRLYDSLRVRLNTSPSYSSSHIIQADFLRINSAVNFTVMPSRLPFGQSVWNKLFPADLSLTGGYSMFSNSGLLVENRFSEGRSLNGRANFNAKLPNFFRPFTQPFSSTSLGFSATLTEIETLGSPFFDALSASLSASASQVVFSGTSFSPSYTFSKNVNTELSGSDYAYESHRLGFSSQTRLPLGMIGSAGYGFTLTNYTQADSNSGFTKFRKNKTHSANLGVSYRILGKILMSATVSYTKNLSNLPIGFIRSTLDIIEGLQSSSLGDYEKLTYNYSLSMSF